MKQKNTQFAALLAGPIALMLGSSAQAADYNYGSGTQNFNITATDQARAMGWSVGTFNNSTGDTDIYWRGTASDVAYLHFDLSTLAGKTIVGNVSLNQTVNAQYGGNISNGQVSTANAAWTYSNGGSTPGFTAIGDSPLLNGNFSDGSTATWTVSETTFQGFVTTPASFHGFALSGGSGSEAHFSSMPTLTGAFNSSLISVTHATDWSTAAYDDDDVTLSISGSNNVMGGNVVLASSAILAVLDAATLDSGNFAGTISNYGTLSLASSANQTLSGVISGTGELIKAGSGTLTLTAENTYSGSTTIEAGTLRLVGENGGFFSNTSATRNYIVNSGAVLNLHEAKAPAGVANILGTGTLRITGVTLGASSDGRDVNFILEPGALIDFPSGSSIYNGGWQAFQWAGNQAALNVDGQVNIADGLPLTADALTGSGTIGSSQFGGSPTVLTVGVANGSGAFSGTIIQGLNGGSRVVALTKSGSGNQTLSGTNTYSGPTTIAQGTLSLGNNNVLADTSDMIIGSGTLNASSFDDTMGTLNVTGAAVINLASGANLAFANSSGVNAGVWAGTLNITGTLEATSLRFGTTSGGLSTGQLALISVNGNGLGTYTLDSNGYLVLGGNDFTSWAANQVPPVTGGPNGDSNDNGVPNLVEYALVDGGERGVISGNAITFTKRGGLYGTDITYIIETSETLDSGSWTVETTHGPELIASNPTIGYTFTFGTPAKKFARLKVTSP
jgi:autotransporter-associated beta strand protein